MVKIPQTLRKNGFNYKLMKRTRMKAMYRMEYGDNEYFYEVFLIQVKSPDKFTPFVREAFPADKDFGKTAWAYRSLCRAEQKYEGI